MHRASVFLLRKKYVSSEVNLPISKGIWHFSLALVREPPSKSVEIRRRTKKNVEEPKNPSKPVDAKIFHFFAFFGSLEAGNQNLRIFVSCYSQKHKNISMAFTWKLFGGQPSASSSLARLGADMKVAGAVPLLLVVFKDNLIKLRFCSMCFDWNEHIQFLRKLPYKGYICHAFCSNMWTFCKWMLENGTEQGFQNVVVWNLGKGFALHGWSRVTSETAPAAERGLVSLRPEKTPQRP